MTNMDGDRIEQLLRQVQPAGPSPELRARILSVRRLAQRSWPWAAAAAALFLTALGLELSAGHHRRDIRPASVSAAASEDPALETMRQTFGLTEVEVRALSMKRDFERLMARDAPQEVSPQ
jgi:hypothetical protein